MDVEKAAAELFADAPALTRAMQRLRPRICPFDELLVLVPGGASGLDVGCGAGLFLGLLAHDRRIGSGLGFDADAGAIAVASRLRLLEPAKVRFERRDAAGEWPDGKWDVVSLIDVLHHVPVASQREVVERAAARVARGGILLCKDIAPRPRWRAFANRVHDLVLARQWVHHVSGAAIAGWAEAVGLVREQHRRIDRWWYAHEIVVLRRP